MPGFQPAIETIIHCLNLGQVEDGETCLHNAKPIEVQFDMLLTLWASESPPGSPVPSKHHGGLRRRGVNCEIAVLAITAGMIVSKLLIFSSEQKPKSPCFSGCETSAF